MINQISAQQKADLFQAACKTQKIGFLLPGNTYRVGCAVLTRKGNIYTGCNIENSAHTPTVCAERVALFKAYSEEDRDIIAMTVVSEEGGTCCGVCRQTIADLAPNMVIILADVNQTKEVITNIDELLPFRWTNPTLPEASE